ncbi:hypothetical protein BG011_001570 [Mortierella polycephala]|uniref:Uncharacterized protein n=1 Tax=Mortierella polycephala TaxID=41804 RepID=A0A9P6Q699_9FUNG|nr:hypothetical protein BG011_001570 [Mortierella polycephala]
MLRDSTCKVQKAPKKKEDFAAKGYSALATALALGAALGPLAGGNLTKTQVPGFESYPFTRCPFSLQSSFLSPATEPYLIPTIYTLLVLTSILGSGFGMLYTQSPPLCGGLEFSAKVIGQMLTIRGFLKLMFNLIGYPWMVHRFGLLSCLRFGIIVIATASVLGLGWFVPWNVEMEKQDHAFHSRQDTGWGAASGSGAVLISGPGTISNEKSIPVGMSANPTVLEFDTMRDVLGYISVLVLFGKSADRLLGADSKKNNATGTTETTYATVPSDSAQGRSGVLRTVAQFSANVMRLTGPVLAGSTASWFVPLLWSLTAKSGAMQPALVTVADLSHASLSSASSSSSSLTSDVDNIACQSLIAYTPSATATTTITTATKTARFMSGVPVAGCSIDLGARIQQ